MSIFIDNNTKVVVQGITGRDGSFHAKQMLEYGTCVVAGVTPGKGGQRFEERVPIYNTMAEAVARSGANTSVIYVQLAFAADAMMEAADHGRLDDPALLEAPTSLASGASLSSERCVLAR